MTTFGRIVFAAIVLGVLLAALIVCIALRDWVPPQPDKLEAKDGKPDTAVPWWAFAGIIAAESEWNPKALNYNPTSDTWDEGIAQINSGCLADFRRIHGDIDPWCPVSSMRFVIAHLRWLRARCKTWERAVAAYHYGLGRVMAPGFADVRGYVERVKEG